MLIFGYSSFPPLPSGRCLRGQIQRQASGDQDAQKRRRRSHTSFSRRGRCHDVSLPFTTESTSPCRPSPLFTAIFLAQAAEAPEPCAAHWRVHIGACDDCLRVYGQRLLAAVRKRAQQRGWKEEGKKRRKDEQRTGRRKRRS